MRKQKLLVTYAMVGLLSVSYSNILANAQAVGPGLVVEDSIEGIRTYLNTFYGIEVVEETLGAESFSNGLKMIVGEDNVPMMNGAWGWESMVQTALEASNYKELAMSYTSQKASDRLASYGISGVSESFAPTLACALDVSLISPTMGKDAAASVAVTASDVETILLNVANAIGEGRNYIGMASDPSIYGKIDQEWDSFILFDDEKLAEVGRKAVEQGVSTGYGLKSSVYSANFLPELTLQYGHSDIMHAHQLIGLLNSEDIDAKVQLEPKISIYQYMPEWGPVPDPTPTYEVKVYGDLMLVHAVEYDLQLEFNNAADMLKFDDVIKAYAKKYEGNEEAVGLIYGAWWQPLYSTENTQMPADDYRQIYDCVVTNGEYTIHPFALPENVEQVKASLTALAGDLTVDAKMRFCNVAFHNYLTGADYQ